MSRASRQAKAPEADANERTEARAVPEGRGAILSREAAQGVADGLKDAGFPVPPNVKAALRRPATQPAEPTPAADQAPEATNG